MIAPLLFSDDGKVYGSDYDMNLECTGANGFRKFYVANQDKETDITKAIGFQQRIGSEDKWYDIYGKHNKPTGSYTGNGSGTSRTIATGGIGTAVLITSNNGVALVTRKTGFCGSTNSINALAYNDAHLAGGDIIIASVLEQLNTAGVEYTWQVL